MERKEERRNIMGIGMRKRGGRMGKKERRREDKWREGWGRGKSVQQVIGTLVCQSEGRLDGHHASLEPRLRALKS